MVAIDNMQDNSRIYEFKKQLHDIHLHTPRNEEMYTKLEEFLTIHGDEFADILRNDPNNIDAIMSVANGNNTQCLNEIVNEITLSINQNTP